MGELLVYSASAGSGKTHSIAGQYILMLFAKPTLGEIFLQSLSQIKLRRDEIPNHRRAKCYYQ